MSPSRARATVVLTLGLASVVGCAYDFDGLFESADTRSNADGGVPEASDGASPDVAASCRSEPCSGSTCGYACGDGCRCPRFECPGGEGDTACDASCGRDATCDVRCKSDDCVLGAHGSAKATFECDEADSCKLTCDGRATCELRCKVEEGCSLTCEQGSSCLLRCESSTGCNLDCPGGAVVACAESNTFACNRPCP